MDTYAKAVIDALGGTSAVAKEIGAPTSTVHSWRTGRIPNWRMDRLKALAKSKKIELPEARSTLSIGDGG